MKNKKILWGTIIVIVLMLLAVFVPKAIVENTLDSLKEDMDAKYDEDFKIAWNSLEDTPMKKTYTAILKSQETGITYNVDVKDSVPTMYYEEENFNAEVNEFVEAQVEGVFSMANASDSKIHLNILADKALSEADINALGEALKTQFNFTTVEIQTYQMSEESYTEAKEQISEYYQRSIVPMDSFEEMHELEIQNYTM